MIIAAFDSVFIQDLGSFPCKNSLQKKSKNCSQILPGEVLADSLMDVMFNTIKFVKPNNWSVGNLKSSKISKYIHDAKIIRVRTDDCHGGLSKFIFCVFLRRLWENTFQNFSCETKV